LEKRDSKNELLFVNRIVRLFSANKLRETRLQPLWKKLGIPRGGFRSMRHGWCATTQRRLSLKTNCVTVTHESRWESLLTWLAVNSAMRLRIEFLFPQ
jgi:hypothetical protein